MAMVIVMSLLGRMDMIMDKMAKVQYLYIMAQL